VAAVADFVPLIVAHFTETNPVPTGPATLLQSISIGDPRAENEMTTRERYYLTTDQFERAIRGEVNLVVGRKGSGKTARCSFAPATRRAPTSETSWWTSSPRDTSSSSSKRISSST
jgi:hypothetical protein